MPGQFRTWCEIDLSAIADNLQLIRKKIGRNRLIAAVVKADAYGHGLKEIAEYISRIPKLRFAVATPDEGIRLREIIPHSTIQILSCLRSHEIDAVIESNCIPNIAHEEVARKIDRLGKKQKRKIKIHIEVDTGIGRIGPYYREAPEFIRKLARLQNIEIEGLFTHFATAEDKTEYTQLQISRFEQVLSELRTMNIRIPIKHTANSAGVISHPKSYYQMVRPGLMIYGLYPSSDMKPKIQLEQAMSLKSIIIHLRKVKAGYSISYGRTFITTRPTVIATVNVGYRNGYSRLCSNRGQALVHGQRVAVIGRICMDQLMLDVTSIKDVKLGDEAVFLGKQGKEFIAMDEIAGWCSSINYETSCFLGSMNKRIYR